MASSRQIKDYSRFLPSDEDLEDAQSIGCSQTLRGDYRNWLQPSEPDPITLLERKLENNKKKSCIYCIKQKRVERVTEIKRGQHISMPGRHFTFYNNKTHNKSALYTHHAIVKNVVSYTNHRITVELIHFYSTNQEDTERTMSNTSSEEGTELTVVESRETYDLKYDDLYIVQYQYPKYTEDEIIERAESVLRKKETITINDKRFPAYDVLNCNCEHFAHWCVAGENVSFQSRNLFDILKQMLISLFGNSSNISRIILRIVTISSDELANALTTSKALPLVILGCISVCYLIYTIVRTAYLLQKYKNGEICWSCLKTNILCLWMELGTFAVTSLFTYLLVQFALPLLAPGVGIPLVIAMLLLSIALVWLIPYLIRKYQSPFQCDKRKIENLSDVKIGDVVAIPYYGLRHQGIVTMVECDNDVSPGRIRMVHYSLPSLWSRRIIQENKFTIDPKKQKVEVSQLEHLDTFSAEETVKRARKRIGEKKWNHGVNRSPHFCYWAKVKTESVSNNDICLETCDNQTPRSGGHLSTFFVGYSEVHLMEEIEPGDAVQYKREYCIVIELRNKRKGRVFEMDIMVEKGIVSWRCKLQTRKINLDFDNLYLLRYHPARCHSKLDRRKRALGMRDKSSGRWTQSGYIEECIMRK